MADHVIEASSFIKGSSNLYCIETLSSALLKENSIYSIQFNSSTINYTYPTKTLNNYIIIGGTLAEGYDFSVEQSDISGNIILKTTINTLSDTTGLTSNFEITFKSEAISSQSGTVVTLYSDEARTNPIFPRTTLAAISGSDGTTSMETIVKQEVLKLANDETVKSEWAGSAIEEVNKVKDNLAKTDANVTTLTTTVDNLSSDKLDIKSTDTTISQIFTNLSGGSTEQTGILNRTYSSNGTTQLSSESVTYGVSGKSTARSLGVINGSGSTSLSITSNSDATSSFSLSSSGTMTYSIPSAANFRSAIGLKEISVMSESSYNSLSSKDSNTIYLLY